MYRAQLSDGWQIWTHVFVVDALVLDDRQTFVLARVLRAVNHHLFIQGWRLSHSFDSFQFSLLLSADIIWVDVELVGLDLFLPLLVDVGTDDPKQRMDSLAFRLPLVRAIPFGDNMVVHLHHSQEPHPWVVNVLLLPTQNQGQKSIFERFKIQNNKNAKNWLEKCKKKA